MSRRVNQTVIVDCNGFGEPVSVTHTSDSSEWPVLSLGSHWREWMSVLDGEPERDVWLVELSNGVCELHCLRFPLDSEPTPDTWLLYRWED